MVKHSGDTGFTTVIVADIQCYLSLEHLYFGFVCLGVRVPYDSSILQSGSNLCEISTGF